MAQGYGEWGLWSVRHTSLPLLPPQGEDSSHSAPAPAWGPFHGRLSSTNCSSVGPSHRLQLFTTRSSMGSSHGVQSFRNRLLQSGSLVGSQVLPANLLQRGLLSPWGHRSCQEPTPVWAPHEVTASCGDIHLFRCGVLRGLQVDICSTMDRHGLQGDSLPCHDLLHRLQGKISALVPGAPPAPPSSLTLVSAELFLSHSLTLFLLLQFFFMESLRLEKTSEIIRCNRQPITTMPTKPCPKVQYLHIVFYTSRNGDSTTSLGSLFQCLTTLSVKKFSLISNLTLPWCNFRPLLLILSLVAWEKRPAPTSLQPPFR